MQGRTWRTGRKVIERENERERERREVVEYDLNLIFHDCLKDFSQINVTLYPSQCQPESIRRKQKSERERKRKQLKV